jgi:hypothetical protein
MGCGLFLTSGDLICPEERNLKHLPSLLQRLWSFLTQGAGWSVDHCCQTSRLNVAGIDL